jgi:Lar family restriction alleviation protein
MQIKPCPFCGSNEDISIFSHYDDCNFALFCACGFGGVTKKTREDAIQAWNQRPYDYDMPAIVKKVQQLEKENAQLKKMLALGVNYERANG